ncbi:MAG: hypothetical protein AAF962_20495 [Actinomycetota bacterium]
MVQPRGGRTGDEQHGGAGAQGASGPGPAEQELTSLRFAAVARRLSEAARSAGAEVPAFRSPPRPPGARRTIRRERGGAATVAVLLRGRPASAVIADMIDGVIAAADLSPAEAATVRDELWLTAARFLDEEGGEAADPLLARQAA